MKTRALLAIFIVFSLLAQAPPVIPPSAPVLRSTTRLIQINLVAQDKRGNPITDLTRDDFVLTDAGKGQKISLFQLERAEAAPAVKAPVPNPAEPGVITLSNHVEQSAGAVTVILFDALNTKFQDQSHARNDVIKYLKQASPSDRIALYSLGKQLRILHDFTNSTESLIHALNGTRTHALDSVATDADPDDSDTGDQNMDDLMNWANGQLSDYLNVNRADMTLAALQAIAQHVSRIPGRKNLVWISGGFPFSINQDQMNIDHPRDSRNFSDETQKMARFLNDANMAIYAIDARGVFAPDMPDASRRANGRAGAPPPAMKVDHARETFDIVAERTGGKSFHNTNDLGDAIRRAVEDARVTYVIGYYPADATWDGQFHQIKLQCKRSGVQMRYRPGYFATSEPAKPVIASATDAVRSTVSATDIGLTVALTHQKDQLEAIVTIQTGDLSLAMKDGKWSGQIEYLAVSGNAETGVFKGKPVVLNLGLQPDGYESALKTGIKLKSTFPLEPDVNQFRIAVRDMSSGAVGSLIFNRNPNNKPK